jgi:DNA-directed RNA polymerase specialized sigma24 family protein
VATTARNESLRLLRQAGRVRLVDDDALFETVGGEVDPAPAVESVDRDAVLRTALDALPPRQRAVLDLLMADPPASYGDIAADLNIPIGSIGPTRQRSLQSLRTVCLSSSVLPG